MTQNKPPTNTPKNDAPEINRIVEAFAKIDVPDTPDTKQTLAFLESADTHTRTKSHQATTSPHPFFNRRTLMRLLPPLSAAAVIVIAATLALTLGSGTQPAFAQVREKLASIQTATFTIRMTTEQGETNIRCWIKNPGFMRQEIVFMNRCVTTILDYEAKRMLTLVENAKIATIIDVPDMTLAGSGKFNGKVPQNIIESFRAIDDENTTYIGIENIDGQRLIRYDFTQGDYAGSMWVDPQTDLPHHSVMTVKLPGANKNESKENRLDIRDFVWNAQIDDALFDMTIPEGYTTSDLKPVATGLEDLKTILKIFAYHNDGVFPARFDAFSMFKISSILNPKGLTREERANRWRGLLKVITGKDGLTPEQMRKESVKLSSTIGNAALFAGKLQEFDYRWTGSGVKLGDASRVICHWQTRGVGGVGGVGGAQDADTRTAIYGDLTVKKNVDPSEMP